MDRHCASRIVRRVARRAGISKPIGPHTLRHAFITAALDAESHCATSKKPHRTPTRAPPCAMTGPGFPSTATPPTSSPPTSQAPLADHPAQPAERPRAARPWTNNAHGGLNLRGAIPGSKGAQTSRYVLNQAAAQCSPEPSSADRGPA